MKACQNAGLFSQATLGGLSVMQHFAHHLYLPGQIHDRQLYSLKLPQTISSSSISLQTLDACRPAVVSSIVDDARRLDCDNKECEVNDAPLGTSKRAFFVREPCRCTVKIVIHGAIPPPQKQCSLAYLESMHDLNLPA